LGSSRDVLWGWVRRQWSPAAIPPTGGKATRRAFPTGLPDPEPPLRWWWLLGRPLDDERRDVAQNRHAREEVELLEGRAGLLAELADAAALLAGLMILLTSLSISLVPAEGSSWQFK
jgi:hypothetical protein